MNNKVLITIGIVATILIITLVAVIAYLFGQQRAMMGGSIQKQSQKSDIDEGRIVACPMDAKICPDGSAVSRTGVNCEFEACPSTESNIVKDSGNKVANDKKQGSKIESVDNLWNRYTNYDLGFTIKFPKETNRGDGVHFPEIIENGAMAYITSSNYNQRDIQKIKDDSLSIFEKSQGTAFVILVQEVSNDEELEKFIQDRYDKTCNLDGIKKTDVEGVFDVMFSGEVDERDAGGPPINCFINYGKEVKYSPAKGLVAAWDIGQDPNFNNKIIMDNYPNGTALDFLISDSFEFLK